MFNYYVNQSYLNIILAILLLFLIVVLLKPKKDRDFKLRSVVLSSPELELHAKRMALEHTVSPKKRILSWPLSKMNENYGFIHSVYKALNEDIQLKRNVSPAAEWLLDNFYIIEEQVKNIRRDLNKKNYYNLPVLVNGPYRGHSRVFVLAIELIENIDGQIDENILMNYLKAYQANSVLLDREIWVLPTMIRLALIENVKILCESIKKTRNEWQIADEIVDKWWSDENIDAENVVKYFNNRIQSKDEINASFVEHLFYRLRRAGHSYTNVLKYIDEKLNKFGTTTEEIAQKEHNFQAVCTVSMGNCIISLKQISTLNWVDIFEAVSAVEQILRQDPDQTYHLMDIKSRNFYREKIESLAKKYSVSEIHLAREAINLSKSAFMEFNKKEDTDIDLIRKTHVGYYLINKGLKILEAKQKLKIKITSRISNGFKNSTGSLYFILIGFITILITFLAIKLSINITTPIWIDVLIGISTVLPASEMAVSLVNWFTCKFQEPYKFPRLELKDGIPKELSTMIVIPTLLTDEKRVEELLENLENHYLSNREENLFFALIGAFKDSNELINKDDGQVINSAFFGIKALNLKYAKEDKDIFYFYHRVRKLNEIDNNWTGWERKRGALMELNDMLLGSKNTTFSYFSNTIRPSEEIKYIITLDADTVLPIGMAKKMIGTMAHTLNRPVIDENKSIVVDGYGLMQPKITFDLESCNRSLFSCIYTGQEGIDPYASAISDVYQDIFHEGIFTGKGIYDLKVFQSVLKNAIPENAVLSHDLLEGSYVRAALVTDLELVDSYPSKYNAFSARLHRWIRGDWQLIPWLGKKVYDRKKRKIKNPLSKISRWKIADNLRRSLIAPSIMFLIMLGISIFPGNGYYWIGFALTTLILPFLIAIFEQLFINGFKNGRIKRYMPIISGVKAITLQLLLVLVLLPYQAYLMLDAIIVTLIRLVITKKNMLEWVTSADVEKTQKNSIGSYWSKMFISVIESLIIVLLAVCFKPNIIYLSLVLFILWGLAPFVAYFVSIDRDNSLEQLEPDEISELGRIARKTWRYYEEFANFKNNYLAPDNFQEEPARGIAYRTSPTNIGLGLLATLSGRDLGYTGIIETTENISKTIATIEKLEKWKGHLYNWYDTRTLDSLKPIYISTVDSGNFVCYLITLIQGLKNYLEKPLVDVVFINGFQDTLYNGMDEGNNREKISYFNDAINNKGINIIQWYNCLGDFLEQSIFLDITKVAWKAKVERMTRMFKKELNEFMPWIPILEKLPLELLENEFGQIINEIISKLSCNMKLKDIPTVTEKVMVLINKSIELVKKEDIKDKNKILSWLSEINEAVQKSNDFSINFIEKYNDIINRIESISENTKFKELYDDKKQLFSIGYSLEEQKLTNSYYDLLASECRQTSYLAIARGEVSPKHWSVLSRSLTAVDRFKGLVSWTGTMFEYLMPLLIMKSYKNTLLDETYSFVVKSQIKYGKQRGMPWGTSESGFNSLDINLDYQYKAIGVPWLGLKRGLIEDAVTAPYATFLALLVDPKEAYKNINVLKSEGLEGPYGYYEAADYTPERLAFEPRRAIVKSFMAHHQGMSLLAINNYLNDNIMQRRFHADAFIKSGKLLLQEKVPQNIVFTKETKEKVIPFKGIIYSDKGCYRRYTEPDKDFQRAHVLSNGNYSVMLTDRGAGYSKTKAIAISRWREDSIINNYGMFFYIKDVENNSIWSSTYSPLNVEPEKYEVIYTPDKATFKRVDGDIETQTDVIVTSGDNAEIRRLTLKNNGKNTCVLEITSYFEVILASQNADLAHPAFSNLFVKTEFDAEHKCLIANRRPRTENDKSLWVANTAIVEGEVLGSLDYETDRMQFIGRGNSVSNPIVISGEKPLSNSVGAVLDPIFCLRIRVKIEPSKTAKISFLTITTESRETVLELVDQYSNPDMFQMASWLALTRSQVENRYLNIKSAELKLYQEIMPHILFMSPLRRTHEKIISKNVRGQSALWSYGISGDRPIIVVKIDKTDEVEILYEVLKAHEYWRLKDLKVDLVILSNEPISYLNPLFALIKDIIHSINTSELLNRNGDIFILNTSTMPIEDVNLFFSVARFILTGNGGTLEEQGNRIANHKLPNLKKLIKETRNYEYIPEKEMELQYFNGLGGFNKDGSEYIIKLNKGQMTPAPWTNVISNQKFGFIVTESGGGYTWCENSRENKITPWSNDPVSDNPGEVFYLGDETGKLWTITPLPIREEEPYTITHGFGYTEFKHLSNGIDQNLIQFVPVDSSVKVSIISLKNLSNTTRDLSLTYYLTPVLGVNIAETAMHINTSKTEDGILLIKNNYNREFSDKTCFVDTSIVERTITGDRKEFFGTGSYTNPFALKQEKLSGSVGCVYDPCGAMQVSVSLQPNETKEIVFLLGMATNIKEVNEVVNKYKKINKAKKALEAVTKFWKDRLDVVKVSTPDQSMNIMLNGWLLYQVMSCRLWSRSAFYQSGGAFGFRDQLQDSMAILNICPELVKEQIIKHAKHQFIEGDVLHWWHEPELKGTRTKISDDLVWLPFVTAEYIKVTGDSKILDIEATFLEEEILKEHEDERYCRPRISRQSSSIYDHCIRTLEKASNLGVNGLPLMGCGDWNDGMNTVGNRGKGESVWLAWFLCTTLQKFIPICIEMGDIEHANKYEELVKNIAESIEKNAWDGNWYRRAYFDNGEPLGSSENSECKIDAIAQAWAVISGLGEEKRILKAMNSLEDHLIMKEEGIIKLLTPPFNESELEPGYIKGYVPGVRENGGQYTHAAAWVIIAFAQLGDGDKAMELFELINPINHTRTNREYSVYKVEPYVMAADVYAVHPHVGRGGWTWYTGSASWMYRAGIENILGFKKVQNTLVLDPCIPKRWQEYSIEYKYLDTVYNIKVKNPKGLNKGVDEIIIDGKSIIGVEIELINDKETHQVEIVIG